MHVNIEYAMKFRNVQRWTMKLIENPLFLFHNAEMQRCSSSSTELGQYFKVKISLLSTKKNEKKTLDGDDHFRNDIL